MGVVWWTDGVLLIKHLKTKQNEKKQQYRGKTEDGTDRDGSGGFFCFLFEDGAETKPDPGANK